MQYKEKQIKLLGKRSLSAPVEKITTIPLIYVQILS